MNYVAPIYPSKLVQRALGLSMMNFRRLRAVDRRVESGIPPTVPWTENRSVPSSERSDQYNAVDLARYAVLLALCRLELKAGLGPEQLRRFLFESISQDTAIRMLRGEQFCAVLVPPDAAIHCVKSLDEVAGLVVERGYFVNATQAVQRAITRVETAA